MTLLQNPPQLTVSLQDPGRYAKEQSYLSLVAYSYLGRKGDQHRPYFGRTVGCFIVYYTIL